MQSLSVIFLLASMVRAQAAEAPLNHNSAAQDSTDKLGDKLIDNMFNRASKALPLHENLDSSTLGKPAALAMSSRIASPSVLSRSLIPVQASPSLQSMRAPMHYMSGGSSSNWADYRQQFGREATMGPAARIMAPPAAVRGMAVSQAASLGDGKILEGKVALVTGASRGIGEAISMALAQAGATVVGTATSDSGAEAISARFTGDLKGKGMKLDVKSQQDVDTVLKAVTDEYGGVDILINNAGITKDTLMLRMSETQWDDVITTNLNSVFKMTKAVLKGMMKKRSGRIISISSVVGSMGNAGQANYAAAKAGMEGFTRAVAREVAPRGITVNSVAPGFIKSDMTDQLKDEWKDELLKSVPAGRLGTPKEIAEAVLFLASPFSEYITGHTLHVNGGMLMK